MNNYKNIDSMPDFSKIIQSMHQLQQNFNEKIQPIIKAAGSFGSKFNEASAKLVKVARPIVVIQKLGKAQFVFWEFLTDEFIDAILLTDNINKTLEEINEKDEFCKVNKTIDMCSTHAIIASYDRVFAQTVLAYRNKHYDLAVLGILSVVDGVLSEISEDSNTSMFTRANIILEKVEETDSIEENEFAILAMALTFSETMESISTNKYKFSGEEPRNLNRHWIMHGRSRRARTKLECIKLFNFLFGMLLINDLGTTENV